MYSDKLSDLGKVLVGEGEAEAEGCTGVKVVDCGVTMMDLGCKQPFYNDSLVVEVQSC